MMPFDTANIRRVAAAALATFGFLGTPAHADTGPSDSRTSANFSGTILLTGNVSVLDRPLPSLNEKLTLDYAAPQGQVIDLRVENYFEGSYNENPPSILGRNINEQKFETQLTYSYPLNSMFSISGAILHHENFTFDDTYWWAIGTLTINVPIIKDVLTLTPNASVEKRLSGGRIFYDASTTLDYVFVPHWTLEANFHRYENFGQSDPEPTSKQEIEIALIHQLTDEQTVALTFFRHIQFGAPNDQFSSVKLKWGISF